MNLLIFRQHNVRKIIKFYGCKSKSIELEAIKQIFRGDFKTLNRWKYIKQSLESGEEEKYWDWVDDYTKEYLRAIQCLQSCISSGNVYQNDVCVYALFGYIFSRLTDYTSAMSYYEKAVSFANSENVVSYLLAEMKDCFEEYISRIKMKKASTLMARS